MANVFKQTFGRGASAQGGGARVSGGGARAQGGTRGTTTLTGRKFDAELNEIGGERRFSNQQILSGSFSSISAFGDIAAGFQKAAALKREARQLDLEARGASLRGAATAINESVRFTESIGSELASSPTILTGSSAKAIESSFEDVRTNINIIRLSAEQRAALARDAAKRARKQSKFAIIEGFFKAGTRAASRASSSFGGGGV